MGKQRHILMRMHYIYDECSKHELCRTNIWNRPSRCYTAYNPKPARQHEPVVTTYDVGRCHTVLPGHYDDRAFARADTTCNIRVTIARKREWYRSYWNNKKCIICGESASCCLVHHHIDPSTKKSGVSAIVDDKTATIADVIEEINKCEIVCLNCHQKIHNGLIYLR